MKSELLFSFLGAVILCCIIYRKFTQSVYLKQIDISTATSDQLAMATILIDHIMPYASCSFTVSRVGITYSGDTTINYNQIGYSDLSNDNKMIMLAQLIVQLAKERYPQDDWELYKQCDIHDKFCAVAANLVNVQGT